MATDPKKSLPPVSIAELAKNDVDRLLQTGLADFSLRELLGLLVSSAGAAERNVYLEKTSNDKPNGFYDRSLEVGTIPIDVRVPRTRSGEFRPATLPSPYRRGYSEEVQSLLLGLLGSSRSINPTGAPKARAICWCPPHTPRIGWGALRITSKTPASDSGV